MVTFMRDNKMKECVESIRQHYPDEWVRIYIADQNESISEETQNYYAELQAKGHVIVKVPYNSGLSYGRNTLVNQVKEPYLMIIDDDFKFTQKTDLTLLKNILESNENIGICGAKLLGQDPYLAWIYYNPVLKKIFKIRTNYAPHPIYKTTQYPYRPFETAYEYSDIVLNCFLAKTEVFKDFQWDNDLVMVEHTDAFLRLKETKWRVVYTTEVECEHNHHNNTEDYHGFRLGSNRNLGIQRFCKKWNLNSLDDIYNIPPKFKEKQPEFIKPIPQPISIIEPKIEKIENYSIQEAFNEITNVLNALNVNYCLLQDTCKDAVLYGEIKNGHKIHLGFSITESIIKALEKIGYTFLNNKFQKYDIYLEIHSYPSQTKTWKIKDKSYQVPYPLIAYLRNTFGSAINDELKKRGYNG